MAGINLTGVQDVWGDLNMGGQTLNQLSDEEQLARKKKIMAAGQSNALPDAMTLMFGQRLNSAGNPRT